MGRNERILIIVNPAAGVISKDIATSVIFRKLRKHFRTVSIINTNSPTDGFDIARNALDQFDVITAFGGDGTINSIAMALMDTGKTLGVLPGGSGNGLVRNLDIPVSWRNALNVLIEGKDTEMDAGKINDTVFFNVAGVGLDAEISRHFNLESKNRGIASYAYYTLKKIFDMPTFRVKITLSGSRKDSDTNTDSDFVEVIEEDDVVLIAFANFRQYGGKFIIAPFADAVDGNLDLCIIKRFKLLKESLGLQRIFTGHIHEFPFYRTVHFKTCEIETLDGTVPFHFDGEYGGEDLTRYKIETLPGRIKIRRPI